MAELFAFVRSFLVLFVIMTLLLQLVAKEGMKKYIHFFSRLILAFGFLYPVLSFCYDGDVFLEKIEYETFVENTTEISKDMSRLEFLQNDFYMEKYEEIAKQDVQRVAEQYVEKYGLVVEEVKIRLNKNYGMDEVSVRLTEIKNNNIRVECVSLEEGKRQGNQIVCEEVKKELERYYQLDGMKVFVCYEGKNNSFF